MSQSGAAAARTKRPVPWKGRARTKTPRIAKVTTRYDAPSHAELLAKAAAAQLSLSDYTRACTLTKRPGQPRAKRKPPVEFRDTARNWGVGEANRNEPCSPQRDWETSAHYEQRVGWYNWTKKNS